MSEGKPKLIVITGPTATGKTSLAIDLAMAVEGEIVNADSMQVYRGMDIGTAKPSLEEREKVPHHLIDIVDPDQEFNAALYRSMAVSAIRSILERKRACFVVGGTGLYIKALLGGLLPSPPADLSLRAELKRICEREGSIRLHKRLEELDPQSARKIHPHDRIRIIRALEIIELTNEPFSDLVKKHRFGEQGFDCLKICLNVGRSELYHRIEERCQKMVEQGLVQETQNLLDKGHSPELKSMKALGYRHMVKFLDGTWDLDTAVQELQKDTRHYAKRQLTWFRADPQLVWLRPDEGQEILGMVSNFLERGKSREDGTVPKTTSVQRNGSLYEQG
ncbi:MAG: tRNA (adenosine(37)-N6)-dimethylallyltransferase MiaA [Deltaproteobacteria bacterium]|nr:tRNA (adenosine(37)-N6)-dimethylallyltransferase MiaA [Deltaproteobacteria bacterium]MBW2046762.1 tRNA (adenosine(37)-N6)-dimethylallyltransferase MiaA [Deltaproteobacteria bacterium]MBW2301240.1 tRNA (adenosine(37)-N6)-dimethylallyltransferase MiaA [Deltaproteobacteria bacterium]